MRQSLFVKFSVMCELLDCNLQTTVQWR